MRGARYEHVAAINGGNLCRRLNAPRRHHTNYPINSPEISGTDIKQCLHINIINGTLINNIL